VGQNIVGRDVVAPNVNSLTVGCKHEETADDKACETILFHSMMRKARMIKETVSKKDSGKVQMISNDL
jgi:hypothetical protein